MVKHKLYYQKSLFSSSSDLCIWDEDGNQYVYDIVYTQQGTRTDLLQFTILPSKRSVIGNIEPHIQHIVYIELPSGTRLAFMVCKTVEDMYKNLTVYCVSQGYLMSMVTVAWWNKNTINFNIKRKIHGHLRQIMEFTVTELKEGTYEVFEPYSFVSSLMNADGEATIEMPSYEDSKLKSMSEIFDKMMSDTNYFIYRQSSEYSSTNKKWHDNIAVGSASDLSAKRTTYTYSDINVITSFKKSMCLDDYYNGVIVAADGGNGNEVNRGVVRMHHLLTYTIPETSLEEVTATMDSLYQTTLGNDWIKAEIEVYPILIEPSSRYIRMFDTLKFTNCGISDGNYVVTGITRYLDAPDKTKFKLTQA